MSTPTPEQFLAQPYDPDEDLEEQTPAYDGDPLVSIAESLRAIASTYSTGEQCEHADDLADTTRQLGDLNQAYDDLEDKHRALYELLADVEKIVAKSSSKVSLDVKAAITAWRNPVVPAVEAETPTDPEPPRVVVGETTDGPHEPAVQCPACTRYFVDAELLDRHNCTAVPAADAPVDEWRAFARGRGYQGPDVDKANRSQLRTLLGLPHFEA